VKNHTKIGKEVRFSTKQIVLLVPKFRFHHDYIKAAF